MSRILIHDHSNIHQGGKLTARTGSTAAGSGDTGTGGGGGGDSGSLALNDLTDVVITTPATADRLRFDGAFWDNSALIWRPTMVLDPTSGNYLPVTTGAGDAVMVEA